MRFLRKAIGPCSSCAEAGRESFIRAGTFARRADIKKPLRGSSEPPTKFRARVNWQFGGLRFAAIGAAAVAALAPFVETW